MFETQKSTTPFEEIIFAIILCNTKKYFRKLYLYEMNEFMDKEIIAQSQNLLKFASGLLEAREKVQMTMGQSRLGVFRQADIEALPGVSVDKGDGAWLRISRLSETVAPVPLDYIHAFLKDSFNDPNGLPKLHPAITLTVEIEVASEFEEAGILRPDNVHSIKEDGVIIDNQVRVTLLLEDLSEMQLEFRKWRAGPWKNWAEIEKPIRKSIKLYKDVFDLKNAMQISDTPPELVWGFGMVKWLFENTEIDLPLVEQQIDIDLEPNSSELLLFPRERPAELNLKPFIDCDVTGASQLQASLTKDFVTLRDGETSISPSEYAVLEPVFSIVASQLDSKGQFTSLAQLIEGDAAKCDTDQLSITSSWAMYCRPRSAAVRVQDLNELSSAMETQGYVPKPILGFVVPPSNDKIETDVFGLNHSVLEALTGDKEHSWNEPVAGVAENRPVASSTVTTKAKQTYFFPLPFNEEQAKIVDLVEGELGQEPADVVSVTGPPGTGKTHTIANLIAHAMANGRRVLVTARTAEAISVVREKLPERLQLLVIASTGTDREGSEQLKAAVSELSDQVTDLDLDSAQKQRLELEARISAEDHKINEAEIALSNIARHNLGRNKIADEEISAMEMVKQVEQQRDIHGWFTDRPDAMPSNGLVEALNRLLDVLQPNVADLYFVFNTIPSPEDLPKTGDLIDAHNQEIRERNREREDPSLWPKMAIDGGSSIPKARRLLENLERVSLRLQQVPEDQNSIVTTVLNAEDIQVYRSLVSSLSKLKPDIAMERVTADHSDVGQTALIEAAMRGATGEKPAPGIFNRALKKACQQVTIDGHPASTKEDWELVQRALELEKESASLSVEGPEKTKKFLDNLLGQPACKMVRKLISVQAALDAGLTLKKDLYHFSEEVKSFFPVGFDSRDVTSGRLNDAICAIKANLPDTYVEHSALHELINLSADRGHSILERFYDLAEALREPKTDQSDIVSERSSMTLELERLSKKASLFTQIREDLALLAQMAPNLRDLLIASATKAKPTIPEDWQSSWYWGVKAKAVENIIQLGNGDSHRSARAKAVKQRAEYMEELIHVRAMLGLKARMTPSIQRSMQAFTQAVSRIGKGTGKTAPRYRRAAQAAAREVAVAAPVWIMPEHRIAEQLPPELDSFDLVILDEASQSDITAVAALARGKKVLIVGDDEQVSPSNVGISSQRMNALRAEYLVRIANADLVDENTSIFSISQRMYPETRVILREHFRSVAPIIQFSTKFYENRLIPLRVAKASERFDPPLIDVFIDRSTRDRKTNLAEANYIVEEIASIVSNPMHKLRDIGVVSLIGSDQAKLIADKLHKDPRIGSETMNARNIICGDARTLQGQERSVIFLSMVATPDNASAQTKRDVQQRFNVAMSRARDRLYLVRSVGIEHLKQGDLKRSIVEHFENPMPEGRKEDGTELFEKCDSGFEREVLGMLLDKGYRARPQVQAGAYRIDIVVEGDDDRRLAIELDGDQYHGPEKWDEDMKRQAALERAGWVFWRVFGSQWIAEKSRWWEDLIDTLNRMKIYPIGGEELVEGFVEYKKLDAIDDGLVKKTVSLKSVDEQLPEPDGSTPTAQGAAIMESVSSDLASRDSEGRSKKLPLFQPPAPLENNNVNVSASDNAKVKVGSLVRVRTSTGRLIEVIIVDQGQHDLDSGKLGVKSPLGAALIGSVEGEEIEYNSGAYIAMAKVISVR